MKTLKQRALKMITLQMRWFLFAYGLSLLLALSFVPKGFSPGNPVLPSCQKQTFPNFLLIKNKGTHLNINSFTRTIKLNLLLKWLLGSNLSQQLNEFLRTPSKCFVGQQNKYYNIKDNTKDNRLHSTNQLEDSVWGPIQWLWSWILALFGRPLLPQLRYHIVAYLKLYR